MADKITLEQVEQLAVQLPPEDQLTLLAHISQRLSLLMEQGLDDDTRCREYAAQVEEFLKLSDEMAAETTGQVDAAEDIRQIREERTSRL